MRLKEEVSKAKQDQADKVAAAEAEVKRLAAEVATAKKAAAAAGAGAGAGAGGAGDHATEHAAAGAIVSAQLAAGLSKAEADIPEMTKLRESLEKAEAELASLKKDKKQNTPSPASDTTEDPEKEELRQALEQAKAELASAIEGKGKGKDGDAGGAKSGADATLEGLLLSNEKKEKELADARKKSELYEQKLEEMERAMSLLKSSVGSQLSSVVDESAPGRSTTRGPEPHVPPSVAMSKSLPQSPSHVTVTASTAGVAESKGATMPAVRPQSAPHKSKPVAPSQNEFDSAPVPEGWERAWTASGRIYYKNHMERSTQFHHPLDPNPQTRRKRVSKSTWD